MSYKQLGKSLFCKASCSRALNLWMSSLYKGGLFISKMEAERLCRAGWHFMSGYSRLAMITFQEKSPKFSLIPKLHMFWHLVKAMDIDRINGDWILNAMCESCSVEEDLIGRYCYLTRHVSPRARVQRSLERYLVQVKLLWRR